MANNTKDDKKKLFGSYSGYNGFAWHETLKEAEEFAKGEAMAKPNYDSHVLKALSKADTSKMVTLVEMVPVT